MGLRRSIKRNLAVRRRTAPQKGEEVELRQVVTHAFPFAPNVIIQQGQHRMIGYKKTVHDPTQYADKFKKGEPILYWHLEATDPKTIIRLLRFGTKKETREQLLRSGFVGFVGDVPNPNLKETYEKFGFTVLPVQHTKGTLLRERARYIKNVLIRGYPKEFIKNPFTRVALRFE